LQDEGGVGCNIRLLPKGTAFRMKQPIKVDGEVNDVRPDGSATLTHYAVAAARLADSKEEVPKAFQVYGYAGITNYMTRYPCVGLTQDSPNVLQPYFVGRGFANTYVVPADRRTATWDEMYITSKFKLKYGYFHSHWQWCEGMYIYLNVSGAELDLPNQIGTRWDLHGGGVRNWNVVDGVLDYLDSTPYTPMCAIRRRDMPYDRYDGYMETGDRFYRLSSPCRPLTALPGMSMTLVVVHSPATSGAVQPMATVHTTVRGWIDSDEWTIHPESARIGGRHGAPELTWWPDQAPQFYADLDLYNDPNGAQSKHAPVPAPTEPDTSYYCPDSPSDANGPCGVDPCPPLDTPFDDFEY